jgi:amidase
VFVGRTNTPELGVLPTTEPVAYGPTRNPWNVSRSPGGSSGGSAAAVAAGLVPIGHGSDGGGSIRIPASACGLVGLKPSRGRVSAGPRHGELLGGLAVEHVLSRSVRDTAAVLDVLAGPMPGDPYCAPAPPQRFTAEVGASPGRLRIGVLGHVPGEFVEVHADCSRAAQAAGQLLESLGHTVEPSYPTVLEESEFFLYFGTIVACELVASLESWSRRTGKAIGARDVEPHTWALTGLGRCPATQLIAAKEWLHGYARRMASWWSSGFDLLVTSTLAHVPPPLGELTSTNENPLRAGERATPFAVFTAPFNATGQPAISLPLAWSNGLPIGVQLVAAYGREDLLIRVASQLEQARPWSDRRPPVSA